MGAKRANYGNLHLEGELKQSVLNAVGQLAIADDPMFGLTRVQAA